VSGKSVGLALLLLAPACATTTVETRVTDPAAIAEARAAGQVADPATPTVLVVVLRLKVDANGGVREAHVVQSAGPRFDQAALQKAYRLHFNPAHKDGQPVESTLRFAFTFSPESEPAATFPSTSPAR
jgi:TonB family protein